MREVTFLHKHSDRWKEFEEMLDDPGSQQTDRLASMYIQITNDLAYAQSQYPDSKTTHYLNELAVTAHQRLYRNKRSDSNSIMRFWLKDIPELYSRHQHLLLISLITFLIAITIGVFSAATDDNFVRSILGDRYVNMTIQNIENQDPLAVYKDEHALNMFLGITINNVRVSFLAFVSGLLSSVGTGYLLFSNGIMVGSFLQFFAGYSLLQEALLVVFIHGTLELSAIVIAGAAGMRMGNSLLFPGTYTRYQSFLRGAREGAMMVSALVPVFITAGLLEGFVTRYTDMPTWLSLSIIISSAFLIIYYFVWLPQTIRKSKKTADGSI